MTAADQVNNADGDTFTLIRDATPPTPDITVPSVAPLTFDVTWSASDAEAGVRHFDVQYKPGAGSWTAWLTATTETNAQFIGIQDQSYTFRLRASDNVGNESGWVESASTTVDAVTKYYHHGGARVAMRQGGEVYYLYGDHLGSTSLTTDDQGSVVHEARYLPFGEERWVDGEGVTDFTFTGQRNEAGFGLLDYNARYYSSYLNRFVSPDSIIPNLTDPQSLNRYSYVYNNPVRHRDGSGHCVDGLTTVACLIAIGVVAAEAFVVGVLLVDRFPMEVEMAQKTGETVGELVGNVEVYPLPVEDELGLLNLGSRPDAGDYPQVPITSPPFVLESPELGAARDHGLEIVPYDTARGERRGRLPNQQRRQPGGPSSIPESVSKNNPSSLHRGPQAGGTFYDPRQTPPTLNSGDAIDVLLKEITDPTKPLSYRVALIPLLAATAAKRVVDPTLNANEEMSNMNNP